MNIINAAFGNYAEQGHVLDADCVIGNSFGTSVDEGSVNGQLAEQIQDVRRTWSGAPVIVDRMLANAFPDAGASLDVIVDGPISNGVGQGVGSWGVLVEGKRFMDEHGIERAALFAQANHIGRVAMQAKKLGIEPIIPAGLPTDFDRQSDQLWTRSLGWWVPREVLGAAVLKLQGKL